jgi:hypothetical protein
MISWNGCVVETNRSWLVSTKDHDAMTDTFCCSLKIMRIESNELAHIPSSFLPLNSLESVDLVPSLWLFIELSGCLDYAAQWRIAGDWYLVQLVKLSCWSVLVDSTVDDRYDRCRWIHCKRSRLKQREDLITNTYMLYIQQRIFEKRKTSL